jgi:hypothetical protein
MILQAAMVVLATALQAPTEPPAPASVLPRDCEVSEEQLLVLAIPDYHERVARSKAHEHEELNDYQFSAKVTNAELTTFGLGSTRYLVAAIATDTGYCNLCLSGEFVIVNLASKTLAWRQGGGAIRDWDPTLRLFHLFPDDPVWTLALSSDRVGDRERRSGAMYEEWLRPKPAPGGFYFETVWAGDVETWNNGRPAGTLGRACTDLVSLWPDRAYRAVHHVEAGWMAEVDPSSPVKPPCGGEDSTFGAVVLTHTQQLDEDAATHALVPHGSGRWSRRDLRPTRTFPFNLSVRRVVLDLPLPARAGDSHGPIPSPSGALVCERTEVRGFMGSGFTVRRRSGGQPLRTVPDPAWALAHDTEYGGYQVAAIGWTPDGARILAVIDTGLPELPPVLVSLTPTADGRGDRWEGLLPEGSKVPSDGFIFDPAASDRR